MKRQNRVAFFNILSTLLLRGISFITMPLFTRLLGDSGYGVTQIYNTWVSVLAIVFTLQTQGTLVNARVEYPEEEQAQYQSAVMGLSLLLFLTCAAAVLCFLGPVSAALKLDRLLIVLMLIQAFGTYCVNFLNMKFVYEFKAGRNMVLSLVVTLVTLGLSLALILPMPQEQRYYGRIVAIAATYGVLGIPACIYILAKGKALVHREYWKFCVGLAIPVVFYNLSDLILGQSDKVMVQQMLDDARAGRYSAALTFGGVMFTIFGALNNTWCPFFFEDMKQGDREQVRQEAKNFLELFTVLSMGFVLLVTEVYHVVVDQTFWDGTMLIPIFVSSYFLNFLCTFPINYEYYRKRTKAVAVVTIGASLLNLGLNYVLIRWLGMAGAAVATMLSHGIQLGTHHVYTRYFLGKADYPFGLGLWGKYALAYFAVVALVLLGQDAALLRWCLGGAIGVWELMRIRKRRVLI